MHLFLSTAGADYSALTQTVTFPPGQISTTVTVSTLDDDIAEVTETFEAFLSSPMPSSSVTISGQDTASVMILDNDGKFVLPSTPPHQ